MTMSWSLKLHRDMKIFHDVMPVVVWCTRTAEAFHFYPRSVEHIVSVYRLIQTQQSNTVSI